MRNPRQIVGVRLEAEHHTGYTSDPSKNRDAKPTFEPVVFEILAADQNTRKWRVTFPERKPGSPYGKIIEAETGPHIPRDEQGCGGCLCTLDGVPITENAFGHSYFDECWCAALASLYAPDFQGYVHNYLFRDGVAFEAEENDPSP